MASALAVLDKTEWLEHAGEPWLERIGEHAGDASVTVVRSWDEALTIFGQDRRYNANGVLEAPCERVDEVLARFPEREAWWQKAREDAKKYTALDGWIPRTLTQERQDLLFENLYEFVSMLLAEIIASPEAGCTYFREQLAWFHAGHFPCGWNGEWPSGRMRVY
ncbi:MAG: hypothetical protein HOO96_17710 [Polyangiaceae bacterium]|nr:hypothetical protein [Polyangiaceae bacterium]